MSEVKDKILDLISSLPPEEVSEVKAALQFRGAAKEAEADDRPDLSNDWVLAGIASYLIRRAVISERGIYGALKKKGAYKLYLSKLPGLMCYIAKLESQVGTKTKHRPKLAFIFAKALAERLDRQGIFCVRMMLERIDWIPEALEQAYPGYVAAGLFRFVIDQKGNEQ